MAIVAFFSYQKTKGIADSKDGYTRMKAFRAAEGAHVSEQTGGKLRDMMPWIGKNKLVDQAKN